MPQVLEYVWCEACGKNTGHMREGANHIVHVLLTLFLCGFWLPIWIIAAVAAHSSPSICNNCGGQYSAKAAGAQMSKLRKG